MNTATISSATPWIDGKPGQFPGHQAADAASTDFVPVREDAPAAAH